MHLILKFPIVGMAMIITLPSIFYLNAYRGRTNQIPGFQNISTNQLKDETLKNMSVPSVHILVQILTIYSIQLH